MKVGMNLLLWTDDPVDESWMPLYGRLKDMGFDGIEVPIFDANPEKFAALGRRLDDLGLERTAITVRNAEDDPISEDASVRQAALSTTKRALDCCEAVSSPILGGPLYAAIGQFSGAGPSQEEWARSVSIMQQAADYAASSGISLTFEFLNRFEIYLLNSTADTARFVADVDRPNVGIHYDTFHAHIEEKDSAAAIRENSDAITHVHISENDRSTPGRGQVAWNSTFEALREVGYDGWLTIEAFGSALPSLTAATKIWRRMFDDEEELAREGHDFIRHKWAK